MHSFERYETSIETFVRFRQCIIMIYSQSAPKAGRSALYLYCSITGHAQKTHKQERGGWQPPKVAEHSISHSNQVHELVVFNVQAFLCRDPCL